MTALPPSEHYVEAVDEAPLWRRRELDDSELDITPMIDITFLLLIFFLVAARLDQEAPVDLPSARHGTAVAVKNSVIITLGLGDRGVATVYTGDGKSEARQLGTSDLDAQSDAITAYVSQELTGSEKTNVLIKAEKGVRHRDVARVTEAVGKVDRNLYVAVLEVQ